MTTPPIQARLHHAAKALALMLALVAGLAGCGDNRDCIGDACTIREDCARAGDEDGNGVADCDDAACSAEPSCQGALCPNGIQNFGEGCDDGNTVDTDACTNTCIRARCGDNIIQAGVETCDDGNTVDTDACTSSCHPARCGDGITGPGEQCDDGNTVDTDACISTCRTARCGDGIAGPGEQCDDGNMVDTDACTNACHTAVCGDSITGPNEQCDDGNMVNTDACTNTCQNRRCGDGFTQPGEACDDGNMINTDGCTNTCALPTCGDGFRQGAEQCDDGNMINTDACLNTCRTAVCGDGIRRTGVEECDDANASNNDACLNTCRAARCGDAVVRTGVEQCDDGNLINTDACTNVCRAAACGDGFVQGAELCDDGNQINTDGCDNTCGHFPTTSASPAGGVFRALPTVTLTADEAATVYYTTDGSAPTTLSTGGASPVTVVGLVAGTPLRFFAVDSAGNQETPRTATYDRDRLGPAAVANFTASPAGANVNLTWINPAAPDFADVVIARVSDLSATVPTDGAAVVVGATVGASTVIYVGNAQAFTDTAPGAGNHTYVAWAHYSSGVYAEGRADGARLEPVAQTCAITIDVTSGTATVTAQPTEWTLAVANYTNSAGFITMDVTAMSGLAGITFNPKLVVTSLVGNGSPPTFDSATGQVDLGAGPMDYQYFGPRGLAEGSGATQSIAISAGFSTSITLGCAIVADQGLIYSDWCATEAGIYDTRGHTKNAGMPLPSRYSDAPDRTCTQWSSMVISPDGRYVYAAPRSGKTILKIDTTTFAAVAGLDVNVSRTSAAAARLQLDPSGRRLYASLMDGSHSGGYKSDDNYTLPHNSAQLVADAYVLEIASATMNETSRFSLGSGDGFRRLLRIALTNDGRRLAAVLGAANMFISNTELHLVDVSSWTELDADPAAAGVQRVALGVLRGPNVVFDQSGRYLVIGQSNGADPADFNTFGVLDLNTFALALRTVPEGRVLGGIQRGNDILLLTESSSQLQMLDPGAGTVTPMAATFGSINRMEGGAMSADGTRLFVQTPSALQIFDPFIGGLIDSIPNGPQYTHIVSLTP